MENKTIVEELNEILAGVYLGHDLVIDYGQKAENKEVKKVFKDIAETLRSHEDCLEMHIRFLEGDPTKHLSMKMMMGKYMEKLMLLTVDSDEEIIKKGIEAVEMGLKACNTFLEQRKDAHNITVDTMQQLRSDYAFMDKQLHALQN